MLRNPSSLPLLTARISSSSNLQFRSSICRLFAYQPWLPVPPLHRISPTTRTTTKPQSDNPNPNANPNFAKTDFTAICDLLRNPKILPGPDLESALRETEILPSAPLLEAIVDHFDSSPKPLFSLFKWAEKQPGFEPSALLFNSMINLLGKAREFDSAWMIVLDKIEGNSGTKLASVDCFAILIRRYARAGMVLPAIRTFEFANSLDLSRPDNVETTLFEVLLDSLSKEGHVSVASEYLDRRMKSESNWIPSIRVYNILLNGWFRMRKLKKVENLWMQMRKEKVMPTVVTYGTLVEGYCRMSRVERAIELVSEMKKEGIEPNAVVFNPIVDALAEAKKFKEALGMLERFSVLESGPTISTYNSLVKGFCKAGDLVGASKILKMMSSRHILPTTTTYNYFLRYFSKHNNMIQEGMNLYTKIIDSGYDPDRLTFHLMLKMLCEGEKLDWAVQVSQEMRVRGFDMDLASSTMLIHLFCKMQKWNEAFAEFEDMICRGIVPQYLTYQRMKNELMKNKKFKMAQALSNLMGSVPHSTKLPNTYIEEDNAPFLRRKTILQKAKAMSNALRTCKDPSKLAKRGHRPENDVESANMLIEEFNRRIANGV